MIINYPVTKVIGYQSTQRFVGVNSGTAVFSASPSIRISGVASPADIVVVQQEMSQTSQIGEESYLRSLAALSSGRLTVG